MKKRIKKCIICNKKFKDKSISNTKIICDEIKCLKIRNKMAQQKFNKKPSTKKYKFEYQREWIKKHPDYHTLYKAKNYDKIRAVERKSEEKTKLAKFGLTKEKYETILKKQNHKCAVCFKHKKLFKYKFAVDHNHKNNKIRGLICHNCNLGIGHLQDNITILKNAIKYIKRGKTT